MAPVIVGIPCFNPSNRAWLPEEDALLGQIADEEIARRTGQSGWFSIDPSWLILTVR
jgi:hypothetical protein